MHMNKWIRAGAMAAAAGAAVLSFAQNVRVNVNGNPVAFHDTRPTMIGGRVMVPLRGVLEELGAYVGWDAPSRTVTATKNTVDLRLRIGDRNATVNGQTVVLDVPATVIGGSTMVPLRFVGESLGADVRWDASTETVNITTANTEVHNTDQGMPTGSTGNLSVTSFTHNGGKWLRTGQPITFTVVGTPGANASVTIPGVADEIPLRETNPGRYVGTWTPVDNNGNPITVNSAGVVARLYRGNSQTVVPATNNLSVDTQRPIVRDVTPEANTTIANRMPNISAVFDDQGGSGIDPNSIRLLVDGRDVTAQATITRNFISYQPTQNLTAVQHTAQLRATDMAGNPVTQSWRFTVRGPKQVAEGLTFDSQGALRPGQEIRFTLRGDPGNRAVLSIGRKVTNLPMSEVSPGVYEARYIVRDYDAFTNERVRATVTTSDGGKYTVQAANNLGMSLAENAARAVTTPVITFPGPEDRATDTLVIRGTAAPYSRVQIHIDYSTNLFGVLRSNGAVTDVTTDVDANGRFETDPIKLSSLVRGSGTTYTITAYTLGTNDRRSAPATVTIKS